MTITVGGKTDEGFALVLLERHLTSLAVGGFRCQVNPDEPPDLFVTLENDKRWGVEVTRAYQQVTKIGGERVVSSEDNAARLRSLAGKLEKDTKAIRQRSYTLFLEQPGPFSSWRGRESWKNWSRDVITRVLDHISSGSDQRLRLSGGQLLPGEPGNRWTIMLGAPTADLESAALAMLRRVLLEKARKIDKWNGEYSQRCILILNCYPLVELAMVEDALHDLVRDEGIAAWIDRVFWSDYPDRRLVEFRLR